MIFVNPYEGDLALIGTTDIAFDGRAEDVRVDRDEIEYLLSVVDRYFTRAPKVGEVVHSFSGVRPLFDDKAANPSAVTRDYVFDVEAPAGQAPMLSVFGGKITTYRRLAEHALEKLSPYLPQISGPWTERALLPGGEIADGDFSRFHMELRQRWPWLPQDVALGYARRYGARVESLLDGAKSIGDLGRLLAEHFTSVRPASSRRKSGRPTPKMFSSGGPNMPCISRTGSAQILQPGFRC